MSFDVAPVAQPYDVQGLGVVRVVTVKLLFLTAIRAILRFGNGACGPNWQQLSQLHGSFHKLAAPMLKGPRLATFLRGLTIDFWMSVPVLLSFCGKVRLAFWREFRQPLFVRPSQPLPRFLRIAFSINPVSLKNFCHVGASIFTFVLFAFFDRSQAVPTVVLPALFAGSVWHVSYLSMPASSSRAEVGVRS